jgi:hypothetical protein
MVGWLLDLHTRKNDSRGELAIATTEGKTGEAVCGLLAAIEQLMGVGGTRGRGLLKARDSGREIGEESIEWMSRSAYVEGSICHNKACRTASYPP